MSILNDLKFIESAMRMVADALVDKDLKLAEACIVCIQTYLNKHHHPRGFFSTDAHLEENFN